MKQNKNTIAKLIFTVLFICTAMIQKGNAQTQPLAEANASSKEQGIPTALIAKTSYTVNKAVDSKISFDDRTPNFRKLTIIDSNSMPVNTVTATTDGTAVANPTKITFDFSGVSAGTYFVKGGDAITLTYYRIDIK